MKNIKPIDIYSFSIFLLVLVSTGAYFFWGNLTMAYLVSFLIGILYFFNNSTHKNQKNIICLSVPLLFLIAYCWNEDSIPINGLLISASLYILLRISDKEKAYVLSFCTQGLSILLVISMSAYLLWWLNPYSDFGVISPPGTVNDYYNYHNYIFFIVGEIYTFRFSSVFKEPGHLAMILSFFIYANKFDFKKPSFWIFVVAIIISFSLAGYILVVLGFVLYCFSTHNLQRNFRYIFSVLLIVFVFYEISINYNKGNNLVNNLIIERLTLDEEKGITGNNRTTDYTKIIYDKMFYSGDLLTGLEASKVRSYMKSQTIHGAGYYIFVIQKGFLGLIIIFVCYFLVAIGATNRRFMFIMLIFYGLAFIQRAYPLWASWIIPFICVSNFSSIVDYHTISKRFIVC